MLSSTENDDPDDNIIAIDPWWEDELLDIATVSL
jgi:hypothetical protein